MLRRIATLTALGLGAATAAVGIVTVALSLVGAGEARPELVTGGIALLLATGLIGGNGNNGNNRADTRRGRRR